MLHLIVVVTVLFGTKILKESFDIVCFVDNLYWRTYGKTLQL